MVEHRFIIVRNNYKKYNSGQPFSFLFFFLHHVILSSQRKHTLRLICCQTWIPEKIFVDPLNLEFNFELPNWMSNDGTTNTQPFSILTFLPLTNIVQISVKVYIIPLETLPLFLSFPLFYPQIIQSKHTADEVSSNSSEWRWDVGTFKLRRVSSLTFCGIRPNRQARCQELKLMEGPLRRSN